MRMDTLVLALGNPLRGDDGVGAAVLEHLSAHDLPEHITLLDGGTAGLETALLLADYRRVFIIDAAEMGLKPGSWRRILPEQVTLGETDLRGTLHSAGLAEALALGAALEMLPPAIVIYGVQPTVIGWEPGLSGAVAASVPAVSAALLTELLPRLEGSERRA